MVKRRTLSRDKVIAKAIELADEAGRVEEISLKTVAGALNVRTPSLYNHVESLEDLYRGMTIWALETLNSRMRRVAAGKIRAEAIWALAEAYRQFAIEHPGLMTFANRAPDAADVELTALSDELLGMVQLVMGSFGLEQEEAIHAIRGFRAILVGFTTIETWGGYQMAVSVDDSFRILIDSFVAGLGQEG